MLIINKRINFFVLYTFLYWLAMIFNFFITSNPYSALHSGRAGKEAGVISKEFFINPAYIVIIVGIIIVIKQGKIIINDKIIMLIMMMILSGINTRTLLSYPITYIYNAISIVLIFTISYLTYKEKRINNYIFITNIATVLLIIGYILAFLRPNIYGIIVYKISRMARGEISLHIVLGLNIVYPSLCILAMDIYKKKKYMLFYFLLLLINIFAFNRSNSFMIVFPWLIYAILRKQNINKIKYIFIILLLILSMKNKFINFFSLGNSTFSKSELILILNGRYELWMYHIQKFYEHFIWGNGPNFLNRYSDYTGRASSEVGLLACFSQYGIIYGGIIIMLILNGIVQAVKIVKNRNNIEIMDLFCSYVFLTCSINLYESFSRIVLFSDILFWFSLFYLNFRKPNFNKIIVISRTKNSHKI